MVHRYHDGTKHLFERHARSLGYLDWASRPSLFRSFLPAREIPLPPRPDAGPVADVREPLTAAAIGDVLRHALGLSAWKRASDSEWPLRVNPSSGNLHPTEAYVVCGPAPGIATTAGVYHYAPDRHAIEQRSAFAADAWTSAVGEGPIWFVALTSIHWREAWKYGERAFRYCQHDLGHAIAAVGIAARLAGWRATLAPDWPHRDIAALTGIDRDDDYVDAEREEPGCILRVDSRAVAVQGYDRAALVEAARRGQWTGQASQLSDDHVQWTFIDDIARATEDPGREPPRTASPSPGEPPVYRRELILQRRSAVALDGRSSIDRDRFIAMLARVVPDGGPPWDAIWWDARIHLALFVHRVDAVDPGLYLLVRNPRAIEPLRAALTRDFAWTPASRSVPLFQLVRGDARRLADRLSCDQNIAADGFFSLGMIAEFDASLDTLGPAFYRHLFWESGIVGQVLYLEAEAAGARGTGIGCFYDDPVHHVLGISGHAFQSLYHFAMGMPVEDGRLTTAPGYAWENSNEASPQTAE